MARDPMTGLTKTQVKQMERNSLNSMPGRKPNSKESPDPTELFKGVGKMGDE